MRLLTKLLRRPFFVPAVLLALVWMIAVLAEFSFLKSFDNRITAAAHDMIGHSRTYDMTIGFLADGPGETMGALLCVWYFVGSRMRKKGGYGSPGTVAASLLWLGVLAFGVYELADQLQSSILRSALANSLPGFDMLRKTYGLKIEMTDRHTFPSIQATMFFFVLAMAASGFGSRIAPLLLLALLIPTTRLLAGAAWMTDLVGGILLGIAFARLCSIPVMRRLYRMIESRVEREYANRVTIWLCRLTARLIGGLAEPSDARNERRNKSDDARLTTLPADLRLLAEEQWNLSDLTLFRTPYKSKVFPVQSGDERFALKVSRHGQDVLERNTERIQMMESLSAKGGFVIPEIRRSVDGRIWVPYGDQLACVIRWMEGREPDFSRIGDLKAVMQLLGRFHAATWESTTDGAAAMHVREQLAATQDQTRVILDTIIEHCGVQFPEDLSGGTLGALSGELIRAEIISRTALSHVHDQSVPGMCQCHGDPHPSNYLILGDGTLALLDLDTVQPGYGYQDLINPLKKFVRRYQWHFGYFEELLDAYNEVRPIPRYELCLLLSRLGHPGRLTKLVASNTPGARRSKNIPLRMWREGFLCAVTRPLREKFYAEAARRYDLPELALLYQGNIPAPLVRRELQMV